MRVALVLNWACIPRVSFVRAEHAVPGTLSSRLGFLTVVLQREVTVVNIFDLCAA